MSKTYVAIERIHFNPNNPRKTIDEDKLAELAASIYQNGIIQPLVVMPMPDGKNFMLVAGERRLRAAALAGLEEVPIVQGEYASQDQQAKIMLIENLQRVDLDPMEEAGAYKTLLEQYGYTQDTLANELGISQSQIANRIRLLELPEGVKELINNGQLSAGHGKELLSLRKANPEVVEKVAKKAVEDKMSVKETSSAVKRALWDSSISLSKDQYPQPIFDISECDSCKNKTMMKDIYQDNREVLRCLNKECWNEKQEAARAQMAEENERAIAERFPDAIVLDEVPRTDYAEINNHAEYCQNKECQYLYQGRMRFVPYTRNICLDPESCPKCLKEYKDGLNQQKVQEEREKQDEIAILVAKQLPKGLNRRALIYIAGAVLAAIEDYRSPFANMLKYLEKTLGDIRQDWGDYDFIGEQWPNLFMILNGLTDEQLLKIILEWTAYNIGMENGPGLVDWFLYEGNEGEADQEATEYSQEAEEENEQPETEGESPVYVSDEGQEYVIHEKAPGEWGTYTKAPDGKLLRIVNREMPTVATKEKAIENLEKWADKKALKKTA